MKTPILNLTILCAIAATTVTGCAEDESCTIRDNGDGTQTIMCGDGTEVTVGADEDTACTVVDNNDGTATISCPDGSQTVVGGDDATCTVVDHGDGNQTVECSDGTSITIGETCTVEPRRFKSWVMFVANCGSQHHIIAGHRIPPTSTNTTIAAGDKHACGLRPDGAGTCWGDNQYGEASVPPGESFVQLAPGAVQTCGLRANGTARCWGGFGFVDLPNQPGEVFTQLGSSVLFTCGLHPDGTVKCFGSNFPTPPANETFVQLSVGVNDVCGLRADGSARCWGVSSSISLTPADERFVQLAVGNSIACGLRADGTPRCWGFSPLVKDTPVDEDLVQLTAGNSHVCGLRPDGTSLCWGSNELGQLADQPGEVFVELAAGGYQTCGLRPDDSAVCWGFQAADPVFPFSCLPGLAMAPQGSQPGLLYELWPEWTGDTLPNFDTLGPEMSTTSVTNVQLVGGGDHFAVRLSGWINVPSQASHAFRLTSDDGSRLLIDGELVVNHDGLHGATAKTSEAFCLEEGWHEIVVEYFESTGGETLSLEMSIDGEPYTPIPDDRFVY